MYVLTCSFWHTIHHILRQWSGRLISAQRVTKSIETSPISKLGIFTVVPRVYPPFRTQWKRFRDLNPSYVKVIPSDDVFNTAHPTNSRSARRNISIFIFNSYVTDILDTTELVSCPESSICKKSNFLIYRYNQPFEYSNLQYLNIQVLWKIRVVTRSLCMMCGPTDR